MHCTVAKRWTFDAAHQLPNHDGKCARPHGHTYTVEVGVHGEVNRIAGQPDEGMVVDFAVLSAAWAKVEPSLDHRDLNESIGDECWPTTAENIAGWLLRHFLRELAPTGKHVHYVRVWETPTAYAEARCDLGFGGATAP